MASMIPDEIKGTTLGLFSFCVGCRLLYSSYKTLKKNTKKFKKAEKMHDALQKVECGDWNKITRKDQLDDIDFKKKKSHYAVI